ncbi:uncharacterized protein MKK02DRAFT_28842 [Dioszegia hungarica]|uniref:RNase III domain-containing protein n=1 Tax=Dioszegia hungarica TaxID=4972 RepID=A0AA38H5A5_9TREE|nr:uncharacterized protein MKK02DRAFT_28842 [Dioszegia hungarica]KAI9634163.1 hypothetical protein MKK02DRAFT_28842 [Dioszegia hungarica]
MQLLHHPLTHIFAAHISPDIVPRNYIPLHTAFDITRLPPLPRILDPRLNAAARDPTYYVNIVPNVIELALLGDTLLKTVIIERLQELSMVGRAGHIANLSDRLNTNVVFCYLAMAYDMVDDRYRRNLPQKGYADVFEAYFGALWRESNDMGKAHVRQVIRQIFSPEVFPIIAAWQSGRREFARVPPVGHAAKRKRMLLEQPPRGVSKQYIVGGGVHGRKRDRTPLRSPPPLHRAPLRIQFPQPQPVKASARVDNTVIDLTLDDDDDVMAEECSMNDEDGSDSDSVVYMSETEWKELHLVEKPPKAEKSQPVPVPVTAEPLEADRRPSLPIPVAAAAGPSRRRGNTPSVFIDVTPSKVGAVFVDVTPAKVDTVFLDTPPLQFGNRSQPRSGATPSKVDTASPRVRTAVLEASIPRAAHRGLSSTPWDRSYHRGRAIPLPRWPAYPPAPTSRSSRPACSRRSILTPGPPG